MAPPSPSRRREVRSRSCSPGAKDVALRRAARYGDGWIGYLLDPDGFARRRSFLSDRRDELRLASEPFTTGMLLPVHVDSASNGAQVRAAARLGGVDPEGHFVPRATVRGRLGRTGGRATSPVLGGGLHRAHARADRPGRGLSRPGRPAGREGAPRDSLVCMTRVLRPVRSDARPRSANPDYEKSMTPRMFLPACMSS